MNNIVLALEGAWHVLVVGLILGAGLPIIFALGIRSLSYGVGGAADIETHEPHLLGKVMAGLCFAIVIAAVIAGVGAIVASGFGWEIGF
ncbi:MAG: hypothetical protein Q4P15_04850 [Propionibacteriaceae bacterium]|nr:hypothetical protein [Propionibacteriaceae bacterium]